MSGNYSRVPSSATPDAEWQRGGPLQGEGVEDIDEDGMPLLKRLRQRTSEFHERKRPRKSRCLLAILLALVLLSLSLAALTVSHYEGDEEEAEESQTECPGCEPSFSGLPDTVPPSQAHSAFTPSSMEAWIANGVVRGSSNLDFSNHTRLDGITFWVNGSDPRHKAARERFAKDVSQVDHSEQHVSRKRDGWLGWIWGLQNNDNRFREQNELLYSLRSARESLKDNLGTLHIVSTDYWDTGSNAVHGIQDRLFDGRRGQLPQWLNLSSDSVALGSEREGEQPGLRVHHDWEMFVPLVKMREDVREWKMRRLPSFDSIAAEAVLGVNMSGLAENSFLASDDMLLGKPLTTADFYTPLYGPVLHLSMDRIIRPSEKPWSIGEMIGLRWSAFLLQKRFGTRMFPYPTHVHKSLNKPLLLESRMMWRREFNQATSHRFRAKGRLANSHMLLNGMIVERHREALLWSFLVAKIDADGNGQLDEDEVESAVRSMGVQDGSPVISGRIRERRTSEGAHIINLLQQTRFPAPLASEYTFSSLDGFPFVQPSASFTRATGLRLEDGPLRYQAGSRHTQQQPFSPDLCRISLDVCWPDRTTRSTRDIFTRFAFEQPSCGDCLISHLVSASGATGLDAFLPLNNQTYPRNHTVQTASSAIPAHLPLGTDWKTLDFSLAAVANGNAGDWTTLRQFTIHLLARYNYVIAEAPASFEQLTSPWSAQRTFAKLLRGRTAFICLNDDIRWSLAKVRSLMQDFFESMWPSSLTRMPFERVYLPGD